MELFVKLQSAEGLSRRGIILQGAAASNSKFAIRNPQFFRVRLWDQAFPDARREGGYLPRIASLASASSSLRRP